MADFHWKVNLPNSSTISGTVRYMLHTPSGKRYYDALEPWGTYVTYVDSDAIIVPLDLITAARIGLIRPGDDSGIGEEQWAWLKLIGLVGETK